MTVTNPERRYKNTGERPYEHPLGDEVPLRVYPPLAPKEPRRGSGGRRSASCCRRQLVMLLCDNSRSMEGLKAQAATEAARDMVYECKMKANGESVFDLSIQWFGDHVFTDDELLLKPVLEINEDLIQFDGSSGGTRIKLAMQNAAAFLREYDEGNLALNVEKDRVPPPIIILMSDGKNGDGDPLPIATQLTGTPLSIGVPPMLITVGIEFDGGEPDVKLLTAMASETEHGQKLYFDISSAGQLAEYLATGASSGATTPDELYRNIVQTKSWQKQPSEWEE